MHYDHFDEEIRDGVAHLRLAGPGAAALTELGDEFLDLMLRLQEDRAVRVILVTDGDNAFDLPDSRVGFGSAGAADNDRSQLTADLEIVRRMLTVVHEAGKPIVTATRGAVHGPGLGFFMAGDVRLASSTATFRAPDLVTGLLPDWGLTFTLPRLVGPGRALDLLWSHRTVDAREAAAMGLIDRVFDDAAWDEEVAVYLARLTLIPQPALQLTKLASQQAPQLDLTSMLSYEYEAQYRCLESRETNEGLLAWQEGRSPEFAPITGAEEEDDPDA